MIASLMPSYSRIHVSLRRSAGALQPARRRFPSTPGLCLAVAAALDVGCGGVDGEAALREPLIGAPGTRAQPFLSLPPEATEAPDLDAQGTPSIPGFPTLLSETGVFSDVLALTPSAGLLPYEIQAPLWSDGALKRRWMALPEGTRLGYSTDEAWAIPEGTIFIKHFEMAMDERRPDELRRLETRLWIMASEGRAYGVAYRWNADQTDAELFVESETEELSIVDAAGETRAQAYYYPGANDCFSCHNTAASYVLGIRTRQLNRDITYPAETLAVNQLVAWSGWELLDEPIDNTDAELSPRLAALDDESESAARRVRSYWDGNCSMCHAGMDGSVPGWDARLSTPLSEQGLNRAPARPDANATHLITPGDPEASLIYRRGDTVERGLRMPPLGRNRVDGAYVELLASWIMSLEAQ